MKSLNRIGLKEKAAFGFLSLFFRRVVLQLIFTVSNVFLARLLFPSDFGMFVILGSIASVFVVFSDLGFAPAIIQKKEEITDDEIRSSFSVQMLLAVFIFIVFNLLASPLAGFYKFDAGENLIRLYSVIFLISPFKLTALALLERNLKFLKLIFAEILPIFAGSAVSVILAFLGFGVLSLVWGIILGNITAVAVLLFLVHWFKGIGFNKKSFLRLAKFGFGYQQNVVLGFLYGPLILLYLGKVVGSQNLGYFQFAASISAFPVAFSEIFNRLLFPMGSRFQEKNKLFDNIAGWSIQIVSFTTLPVVFVGLVSAKSLIHFIYTDRWLPSLPAIYLGLLYMGITAYTTVFSQMILAKGKPKILRNLSLFCVFLTWFLAVPLISVFNFVGVSIASLLVSITGIFLYFVIKRLVNFSFWDNFYPYFFGAVAAVFAFVVTNYVAGNSFKALILSFLAAGICYLASLLLFRKRVIVENLVFFKALFKKV